MAPVKKQKSNKSLGSVEKAEGEAELGNGSVISGQLQKKIDKRRQRNEKNPRGIVFIKHLPHGFFEEQLKNYFEQFGCVTRLRLVRSRRTGNSKGFAFIEFEYPEVAEVAAETMNNYLMFNKLVKAAYIPPEKQKFNYFRTTVKQIKDRFGKISWVSRNTAALQHKVKRHNDWREENFQKRTAKQMRKLKFLGRKYAHLGIDINNIVMLPKISTEEEEKAQNKLKAKTSKKVKATSSSVVLKENEKSTSNQQPSNKKPKKEMSLEDLLGDTIQEDSEDEDYIPMPDSDEEAPPYDGSSDEETYGFTKDSDDDKREEELDDNDEENKIRVPVVKKTKKNPLKTPNVVYLNKMVKRKAHAGIQKLNKKHLPLGKSKVALPLTVTRDNKKTEVKENKEEKKIPLPLVRKTKKNSFDKPLKSSNAEGANQMLKRKKHTNDNKKNIKQSSAVGRNEDSLELAADKLNRNNNDNDKKGKKQEVNESKEKKKIPVTVVKKTKKTSFDKPLKASNVERFNQMLKRKPHTGGVQKFNKKKLKQSTLGTSKAALQLTAAKELAKPLSEVKSKLLKKVK